MLFKRLLRMTTKTKKGPIRSNNKKMVANKETVKSHADISKHVISKKIEIKNPALVRKAVFRYQNLSAKEFSQLLQTYLNAVTLDVSNNNISSLSPNDIPANRSIHGIDLSYNNIIQTPQLTNLSNLIELRLRNNQIKELGTNITFPSTLKHLDLSFNHIEKIENLEFLSSLQSLFLEGNRIAYISSLRSLSLNTTLVELALYGNPLELLTPQYKIFIMNLIPSLNKLNGKLVVHYSRTEKSYEMYYDTHKISCEASTSFSLSAKAKLNEAANINANAAILNQSILNSTCNTTMIVHPYFLPITTATVVKPVAAITHVGLTSVIMTPTPTTQAKVSETASTVIDGTSATDTMTASSRSSAIPWRKEPKLKPRDTKASASASMRAAAAAVTSQPSTKTPTTHASSSATTSDSVSDSSSHNTSLSIQNYSVLSHTSTSRSSLLCPSSTAQSSARMSSLFGHPSTFDDTSHTSTITNATFRTNSKNKKIQKITQLTNNNIRNNRNDSSNRSSIKINKETIPRLNMVPFIEPLPWLTAECRHVVDLDELERNEGESEKPINSVVAITGSSNSNSNNNNTSKVVSAGVSANASPAVNGSREYSGVGGRLVQQQQPIKAKASPIAVTSPLLRSRVDTAAAGPAFVPPPLPAAAAFASQASHSTNQVNTYIQTLVPTHVVSSPSLPSTAPTAVGQAATAVQRTKQNVVLNTNQINQNNGQKVAQKTVDLKESKSPNKKTKNANNRYINFIDSVDIDLDIMAIEREMHLRGSDSREVSAAVPPRSSTSQTSNLKSSSNLNKNKDSKGSSIWQRISASAAGDNSQTFYHNHSNNNSRDMNDESDTVYTEQEIFRNSVEMYLNHDPRDGPYPNESFYSHHSNSGHVSVTGSLSNSEEDPFSSSRSGNQQDDNESQYSSPIDGPHIVNGVTVLDGRSRRKNSIHRNVRSSTKQTDKTNSGNGIKYGRAASLASVTADNVNQTSSKSHFSIKTMSDVQAVLNTLQKSIRDRSAKTNSSPSTSNPRTSNKHVNSRHHLVSSNPVIESGGMTPMTSIGQAEVVNISSQPVLKPTGSKNNRDNSMNSDIRLNDAIQVSNNNRREQIVQSIMTSKVWRNNAASMLTSTTTTKTANVSPQPVSSSSSRSSGDESRDRDKDKDYEDTKENLPSNMVYAAHSRLPLFLL